MRALRDRRPRIRDDACSTIAAFGPRAKPALPALIRAWGDKDRWVRAMAARARGAIGPAAASAVRALSRSRNAVPGPGKLLARHPRRAVLFATDRIQGIAVRDEKH